MRIPPVEPLSEARWNRIERGVFSELDAETAPVAPPRKKAPRRGWLLAGSFAVAASVAAFVGVRTFAGAEREIPVSHVQTGDGESTLTVGDSVIRVAKESAIVVDGDAKRGVLLVLDRGAVSCNVAPRSGRPAYVVQAGNVRVRVVGTEFRVTRAGAGANVEVEHGVVEVTAGGTSRVLRDGQRFTQTEAALVPVAPPAKGGAETETEATVPQPKEREAAPAAPHGAGRRARVMGNKRASDGGIVRELDDAPLSAPATPREQYEQAARLERSDPEGAARGYRTLAGGTGPWAPNALFALARLEASRGRSGEARRLADEYLAKYPSGMNAADARELRVKLR